MKKNNKGYTLVEIIVVVAIIAVVGSGSSISLSLIHNTRVSTTAKTIQSYCKSVRLNNMTKEKMKYIHVFRSDGSYYVYIDENKDTIDTSKKDQQLGGASTAILVGKDASSLRGVSKFTIIYQRNGSIAITENALSTADQAVSVIRVTNGKRTQDLKFSKVTGKVTN